MSRKSKKEIIRTAFTRLFCAFGPQHWWPGQGRVEIIIGAVLTQNTNWQNVERAIARLRREGLLDFQAIAACDNGRLAEAIRPSGYFNVKARRLKAVADFFASYKGGDLKAMSRRPLDAFRVDLLAVHGVGKETADDILLYAFDYPVFVVDAYTLRFLKRHGLLGLEAGYDEAQALFHRSLPRDVKLFNEYHALLVRLGKLFCRTRPQCQGCPLNDKGLFWGKTPVPGAGGS
ncbi:MAG: endonuclease III domain-containing protein [Candidatus Sumerlaeia bacterium]